jgi:hypothetical protein
MINTECPYCHGIQPAMEHCVPCHGSGQHPDLAPIPFTQKVRAVASVTPSLGTLVCDCQRLRIVADDTQRCPICDGARRVTPERLLQVYDLVRRHRYELYSADTAELMPFADALSWSRYGAYAVWQNFRFYIETVPHTPLNQLCVVAYAQDRVRPVGYDGRMILSKPSPLSELPTDWPGCRLPSRDAPIWTPLPKRAAAQWNGGAA